MAYFIVNTPISLINFQIIQFIIHENDVAPTITGWGEFPGTYSWVYSGHNGAATSPHEIAHNLGADDSSDADDGYNLMFSSGQHTTLRKFQWEEIR